MSYIIFPVDWDSKFFGFPVGRINLALDFSKDILAETVEAGKNDYRLIYVFLKNQGADQIDGLEAPCVCYDRKLVFEKPVPKVAPELDQRLRLYTKLACTKRLEALAVTSGYHSRFRKDPLILPFYEQLFLTWINNSVLGGTADAIWIWEGDDGKPSGLATVRVVINTDLQTGNVLNKEARLGMLAVEEKYRRRGVATSLLKACEYWSVSLGLDKTSLVASGDFDWATNMCLKAGYEAGSEVSVYHYWSPNWEYNSKRGWSYCAPHNT